MAKITVIVPCYNQEKYIAECLNSVFEQTFDDYEVIVVNDGSTDDSGKVIKTYVAKYPNCKLISQLNQGVIVARNNAIAEAQGEYIFPLDGDDRIAPTCLEKVYAAMVSGQGDVIYCGGEFFGKLSGEIKRLKPTRFNMARENRVCCSALYRKADWEKYGGYDETMTKGLEDWDFWLNFVEDDKVFYKVDEPLFFYRILENSRSTSISKSIKKELVQKIRKKHQKLYGLSFKMRAIWPAMRGFLYQKKITKSGNISIKICKVPLPIKFLKK